MVGTWHALLSSLTWLSALAGRRACARTQCAWAGWVPRAPSRARVAMAMASSGSYPSLQLSVFKLERCADGRGAPRVRIRIPVWVHVVYKAPLMHTRLCTQCSHMDTHIDCDTRVKVQWYHAVCLGRKSLYVCKNMKFRTVREFVAREGPPSILATREDRAPQQGCALCHSVRRLGMSGSYYSCWRPAVMAGKTAHLSRAVRCATVCADHGRRLDDNIIS